MIKRIVLTLFLVSAFTVFASAAEKLPKNAVNVKLVFPAAANTAMRAPAPIAEPQEIAGQVFVDFVPHPEGVEKDRYLVEYFLDDQLIYKTTASGTFKYTLDTAKYENGRHKLIVNFWDDSGPSAIGVREVVINNKSGA
ncbi:MAG: hypothetical protein WC522_07595 [Candidatus Omnitrophota bacterium]